MLSRFLQAALVLVLATLASAQTTSNNNTIIFIDYTSGFTAVFPPVPTFAVADTRTYVTNRPGSLQFGLNWNGDATDQFSFNIPSFLQITATGVNAAFCGRLNASIVLTNASIHTCNYTANWTIPFSGIFTVTYQDEDPPQVRSDAISIIFSNSSIIGDPQFVGLRGQSYQVHGLDGAVYNLITDTNAQVNSRFTFLTKGSCPTFDGVADTNCWSHPGSYIGEMSFQQVVDGTVHTALISSGSAKQGFALVQVDGKTLQVGDEVTFGSFSVSVSSSHRVAVHMEKFEFELTNSDLFINQQLRAKTSFGKLQTHGLLGQTHSSKTYSTPLRYIEGEVDDYLVGDSDIFGNDFVYNKFQL